MNPSLGLTLAGVAGMAFFVPLFLVGGWWLLLAPLGLVVMVLAIGLGSRL